MKFARYGKSYQLVIRNADDLRDLLTLDESHWAATSAPTAAFLEDPAFLAHLDTDKNGRVMTDEVLAATRWLLDTLADTSKIGEPKDEIPVSFIRTDGPAGQALLTTATYVNEQCNPDGKSVSLAHVRSCMADLRAKPLNGDGILIADAAGNDAELAAYISAAVAATGGSPDLSGKQGVSSAQLAAFRQAITDFLAWKDRGTPDNGETMPFGADTPSLYASFVSNAQAIDHFFFLVGFDRFAPDQAAKFLAADGAAADPDAALAAAPVAKPLEDGSLPLCGDNVNPKARAALAALRDGLVKRVLGGEPVAITEAQWQTIRERLAPYAAYLADKKGAIVEALPEADLRGWAASDVAARVDALQTADEVVAKRVAAFADLERLLLYHRRLIRFLNNFTALTEFYNPKATALFERGRLLIDGRWLNLCMEVPNPAAHAAIAKASGIFTVYAKITPSGGAPYTIVAPATVGSRGKLQAGKRGVFFDLRNHEHDAIVTSVIENPISLMEAVLAPFKNIANMLLGKIDALSTQAQTGLEKAADSAVTDVMGGKSVTDSKPAAPPTQNMGNLFMGVSVSIAALSSGFAFFAKSLSGMSVRARCLTGLSALLIVFGPVILAGVIKLLRQDIGPLLEGAGWSINRLMGLTWHLRRQLTVRKPYPREADGTPRRRRRTILLSLINLALLAGIIWTCIRLWIGE